MAAFGSLKSNNRNCCFGKFGFGMETGFCFHYLTAFDLTKFGTKEESLLRAFDF